MTGHSDTSAELSGLMRQAQGGSAEAYTALLSALVPLLRGVVTRRSPYLDTADVEDVVQEVLISVHRVRATYDPARPFLPWLMAITRNRMADLARRHGRTAAREVGLDDSDVTFVAADANKESESPGDADALHAAVAELPPGQRQAITLLKLQDKSLQQAAKETGLSIGALKVATHRALATLRRKLKHEHRNQ